MFTECTGFVHSVEAGSAVDGPGLRYLIFLAGCRFRCLHCHNPDTWSSQSEQRQSVAQVIAAMESYVPWLKSPGGLTISGGEPLVQPDFVQALLMECKERWNLHTAIETQGYLASALPDSWFAPLDLVLLDIKHMDEKIHRTLTGGFSALPTLETAQRLSKLGKDLWIRHVIIPGYTDSLEHAEQLADFVETLPTVRRVELLPFHQLGRDKWHALGIPYALETLESPDPAKMDSLRAVFQKRGMDVC